MLDFSALDLIIVLFDSDLSLFDGCSLKKQYFSHHIPKIESRDSIHSQTRIHRSNVRFCRTVRHSCLLLAPLMAFVLSDRTRPTSNARTLGLPEAFFSKSSRRPGCTLSRLHSSKEYDRPMTQSIATPEPSSLAPTLDRAGAHQGLGSVTTPPSRRSVPLRLLNFDHFHRLCLLPGRIPGKVRRASVQMLRSAARVPC